MNKPALWAEANAPFRRDMHEWSEEFRNELGQMSGRCLDVGSGPGDAAVDFILPKLNSSASLVCADLSEEMLNFGKEIYKDNRRVSFMKLDIESPNLPEDLTKTFDHITSQNCLHWCQDIRRALKNIFNLLRPGGSVLFTFFADLTTWDVWEALAILPQYQPYMKESDRHLPEFRHKKQQLQTLKDMLDIVGFEIHHCSLRKKSHTWDTRDAMENLLLSVDPFIDGMPPNLREVYMKDLVKQFMVDRDIFNTDDDNESGYSLSYTPFVVYVTKPVTK